MAVTIKDIARKAGVSHTTVSRALLGNPLAVVHDAQGLSDERALRVQVDEGRQQPSVGAVDDPHALGALDLGHGPLAPDRRGGDRERARLARADAQRDLRRGLRGRTGSSDPRAADETGVIGIGP